MKIKYTYEKPSSQELKKLYASVGWELYLKEGVIDTLLKSDSYFCLAYEGDTLLGFVRCLSDYSYICYVQDVIVHPDFQRRRIGTEMLKKVLAQFSQLRQIILLTDNTEKTKAFYESLGFKQAEDTAAVAYLILN